MVSTASADKKGEKKNRRGVTTANAKMINWQ